MKKVLILVLSTDKPPYDKMIQTSKETWDKENEAIFYCSDLDTGNKKPGIMYLPTGNGLFDMGHKNIAAFKWALTQEFDYIARINASCYVDKKKLNDFIQTLPDTGLFMGVETDSRHGFRYVWGGCHYIISRDVIQKIVDNADKWNHKYMEDEAMSLLVASMGIPFTPGIKSCSIDRLYNAWQCISYCNESIIFTDFEKLKPLSHIFYRVKCDGNRSQDEFLMQQLSKVL